MKYKFLCRVEVNWDAANIQEVVVSTNNERNAEKLAIKKLSKRYDPFMMKLRDIKKMCV